MVLQGPSGRGFRNFVKLPRMDLIWFSYKAPGHMTDHLDHSEPSGSEIPWTAIIGLFPLVDNSLVDY